ncbi:TetR family transcriptional regulator [Endozoicomonas sp. OPT23]|uniref:TetR/AcrR family transcriptional regulator n=1 Tax=Endozoicomonas sp. OPT23 TaxID=2072845 RepID=UPI00129AC889|nr:TetR/AcrR family transcriptional regulator [Endozoicomonas sp. OPT23]MRI32745.1 TetR family transcriptional regulator [Endozoicomonas sp. OPT23]
MARPRRSEHSKQSILEKGVELLSEQGYHGTGLKQILDAVQVPKGSFYNYFPSKEHFVAEVIEHYSEAVSVATADNLNTDGLSPKEIIRATCHLIVQFLHQEDCKKGCLLGNLIAEVGGTHKLCTAALVQARKRWLEAFQQLFEQGQLAREFRTDISAEELTILFWNIWEGSLLQIKLEGSKDALDRVLDQTLNTLFRPC